MNVIIIINIICFYIATTTTSVAKITSDMTAGTAAGAGIIDIHINATVATSTSLWGTTHRTLETLWVILISTGLNLIKFN